MCRQLIEFYSASTSERASEETLRQRGSNVNCIYSLEKVTVCNKHMSGQLGTVVVGRFVVCNS